MASNCRELRPPFECSQTYATCYLQALHDFVTIHCNGTHEDVRETEVSIMRLLGWKFNMKGGNCD